MREGQKDDCKRREDALMVGGRVVKFLEEQTERREGALLEIWTVDGRGYSYLVRRP